ncbi:MAG: T9SS type A sorting domain-containing protein [Bacteroidia bacterium]
MKHEYAKSNPLSLASSKKTRNQKATTLAKWCMLYIGLFFAEGLMAQTILLSEDFSTASGTTAPSGWTQDVIKGKSYDDWHFDNPGGRGINTPVSGQFAIFDSDAYSRGGDKENVALVSPAFDASSFDIYYLSLDTYFQGGYGGAIYIEVFDGSNWNLAAWATASTNNAASLTLDISTAANKHNSAKIRFRWKGDNSWYWAIDNVVVTAVSANDNDSDGIADDVDLDDDNDGIPDTMEGAGIPACEDLIVFTGDMTGNIYELNLNSGVSTFKTNSPYVSGVINALSANPDAQLIYYGDSVMLYYWDPNDNTHHLLANLGGKIVGTLESGGSSYYNGNIYIATEPDEGGDHIDIYRVPLAADGKSVSAAPISLAPPITGGYGDIIVTSEGAEGTIYGSTTSGFFSYDIGTTDFNNFGSDGNTYQLGATPDGSLWSGVGNTVQRIDKSGVTFGSTYTMATEATDMTGPFACPQIDIDRDTDGDGIIDAFDLDSDDDGIPDLVEAGGIDSNGDGLVDGLAGDGTLLTDLDGDGWFDTYDDDPSEDAFSGYPLNMGPLDMDGDNIPNYLDLDADGDGILDIVEANGTDSDNNGRVDDAVGSNGYSNSLDPADSGTPYMFAKADGSYVSGSTGLAAIYVDTDGDGTADFLDVDDDNDGILDYIEAQATGTANLQTYYPPTTSVDTNGVSTAFLNYQAYAPDHTPDGSTSYGITPYDHDGDTTPDYLDTDSDNDGRNDIDEAWDALSDTDFLSEYSCTTDADGDGLLSCFDANDSDYSVRINANDPPSDNGYEIQGNKGDINPTSFANLDGSQKLAYNVFPNTNGDNDDVQPDWRDIGCANNAAVQYPLTETDGIYLNGQSLLKTPGQVNGNIRAYEYCDDLIETGWRYYYDPMNPSNIIFAIELGANTTPIEYVELRRDNSMERVKTELKTNICGPSQHPSDLPTYQDLSVSFERFHNDHMHWELNNPNLSALNVIGVFLNAKLRYNWTVYDDYNGQGNEVEKEENKSKTGTVDLNTDLGKSVIVEWYIKNGDYESAILGCTVANDENYDPVADVGAKGASVSNYASFVMPRDWFVHTVNDAPLSAPVKVRFYYDPVDYAKTIAQSDSFIQANTAEISSAIWFKVDSMFSNEDIDADLGLKEEVGYTIMDVEKYGLEQGKTYVQFQNITGFSGGGMILEADPTLAVEWQDVWVDAAPYGAKVQWITASEENVQSFVVERSMGDKLFSPIGELTARGLNGQGDTYSFPDTKLPLIGLGRFYYRIKEVDNNGASQISNIVELVVNEKSSVNIALYPNPVGDFLQFDVISPLEDIQEMLIVDGLGRKVWTGPTGDFRSLQKLETDLQNWSEGIYFLRILTENQTVVHKFLKE